MGFLELFLLAVGLSMDAFAVSVCKGLAMQKVTFRSAAICGVWFGGFQALMPFIGYLLGAGFEKYINAVASWIAFVLLALIGANMIREALSKKEEEKMDASFGVKTLLPLAIATSIDALATGVTFAMTETNIWLALAVVGTTTFVFSAVGLRIGHLFGRKYQAKAELLGGVILVLMGIKILIEHLCE